MVLNGKGDVLVVREKNGELVVFEEILYFCPSSAACLLCPFTVTID